jgi:hypothetical protein
MSRGKYLSLPEARKKKQFDRFAKEHPSEGNAEELDRLIGAFSKTPESADQTSPKKSSRED